MAMWQGSAGERRPLGRSNNIYGVCAVHPHKRVRGPGDCRLFRPFGDHLEEELSTQLSPGGPLANLVASTTAVARQWRALAEI